ncbi:MAG TPA: hypothetical protein VI168_15590 [Croceibacterium sp.]
MRELSNKLFWVLAAATLLASGTGEAKIYRSPRVDRPVEAAGGGDSDLLQLEMASYSQLRASFLENFPSGVISVVISPRSADPVTVIAYDSRLNEIARATTSDGNPVSLEIPVTRDDNGRVAAYAYFVRVTPTGSGYDVPVGTRFPRSRQSGSTETSLRPYQIVVRDAGAAAIQLATASPSAASPMATVDGPEPRLSAAPTAGGANGPLRSVAGSAAGAVADARLFGPLAALAGSRWSRGQAEVYSIDWLDPQRVLMIRREGLLGIHETLVTPSVDGKSLRYMTRNVGAGTFGEVQLRPGNKLFLENSPTRQLECRTRNAVLECKQKTSVAGRWQSGTDLSLTASDADKIAALLARLPAQFPDLPAAGFDARLGVLSAMEGRWYEAGVNEVLVSLGSDANGPTLQLASDGPLFNFMFKGPAPGAALLADTAYATEDNPHGRTPVQLVVDPTGKASACFNQGGRWRACYDIWLSGDRQTARLQYRVVSSPYPIDYSLGWTRYLTRVPEARFNAAEHGLAASLDGRSFMTPDGQLLTIKAFGPGSAMFSWYGAQELPALYCIARTTTADCTDNGSSRTSNRAFSDASDHFSIGETDYRLSPEGSLTVTGQGRTQTYGAVSPGTAYFIRQRGADLEGIQRQYVLRAQTRESNQRFWARFSEGVAAIAGEYGAQMANNPAFGTTDWAARLGVAPGGAASGYSESMGSTTFVQAPPATPEQVRLQDEWERYAIREQLYGGSPGASDGGGSGSIEQVARARTAEQDRAAAESYARRDAAQSEADARNSMSASSAATSSTAAGNAAAQTSSSTQTGGSSSGSSGAAIIVKDDSEERERAAESQRRAEQAAADAEKQRADQAAATAAYERERMEAQQRSEAEARAAREACERTQQKSSGGSQANVSPRATCA